MEAIYKRRSIRKFKDEEIPDKVISQIIKAGMAAPSCKMSNEWIFIVMKDRKRFGRFIEVHPFATALESAYATVLVCADLKLEKEPGEGWWIQDCAAAMENMLIEATDLEVGSLWLGVHPKRERIEFVKDLCKLPENVEPLGMVVLGKALKEKKPNDRVLCEQVFSEEYGETFEL